LHSVLSSINNTSCKKKAIILWNLTVDFQSDSDSFNPTLWEEQRQQRMTVAFEFEEKKEDDENAGKVKVKLFILFLLSSHYFCLSIVMIKIDFGTDCVTSA